MLTLLPSLLPLARLINMALERSSCSICCIVESNFISFFFYFGFNVGCRINAAFPLLALALKSREALPSLVGKDIIVYLFHRNENVKMLTC